MRRVVLFKSESDEYRNALCGVQCESIFVEALQFEMVNCEQLRAALQGGAFSALALTSARAAAAVALVWPPSPTPRPAVFALGAATARAAARLPGVTPLGADAIDARALAHEIARHYPDGCNVLFPCGNLALEHLPRTLHNMNISVTCITAYDTKENVNLKERLIDLNNCGVLDAGVFFSPSGCEYVHRQLQRIVSSVSEVPLFAIGKTTAEHMRTLGMKVAGVSPRPQPQELAKILNEYFTNTHTNSDLD